MARRGLHVPTSAGRLTSCFFFSAGPPSCTPTWTFLAAPFSLFMAGPLLVASAGLSHVSPNICFTAGTDVRRKRGPARAAANGAFDVVPVQ